ncbi:hypothetical protein F751_1093 [Auxenochlorella protothecoides]|uniref:Uncharacterized protein n=1 Tax=Auxenochlorella protothecoides TaxID=3075 RepID=A0A087SCE3_AUXPR|nr:hypothetical protein F751_1093 [Auxenochlorella protothecoides]KFM23397.1 hypothetical protein F751_1093 [Auxenochlorella protothecoides]
MDWTMNSTRVGFRWWRGLKGPRGSHHFPANSLNLAASRAFTVLGPCTEFDAGWGRGVLLAVL